MLGPAAMALPAALTPCSPLLFSDRPDPMSAYRLNDTSADRVDDWFVSIAG